MLARGTDTETLDELYSLRAAYRSMPEYAHFTELAASGTPEEVFSELALAIADAGRSHGERLAPTH